MNGVSLVRGQAMLGGAVLALEGSRITAVNCTFTDNIAVQGGEGASYVGVSSCLRRRALLIGIMCVHV